MRMRTFVGGFALGCATVLFAAATLTGGQDPKGQDPAQQAMEEAMAKYGAPGKEHEVLAKRAGTYTVNAEFWGAPETEAMTTTGTAELAMIMDGRYLTQKFKADFMGMPFEGGGLTGFDRTQNKYVSVWVDNMSTAVMVSEGKATDMGGKTLEFHGTMPDPMTGEQIHSRMVERQVDANTLVFEMYMPGPDGKEFMHGRLTYTRTGQ